MDGIINVHKEKGYTSHDVVAKLRGILGQRKIGHTGTLDPEATGVLPVCLGKATKVCELLTNQSKTYIAGVRLGVVTDTQDMTGTVQEERPVSVTREELMALAEEFTGEIWQTPPMYSAVKVNGKRLYELARQGVEVERRKRLITIDSCEIMEYYPEKKEFMMKVTCSKGTYIRTLCHDMGQKTGCGAAMASLVRTKVGLFSLEEALTLSEIEERVRTGTVGDVIVKIEDIFNDYPKIVVEQEGIRYLQNGNMVKQKFCQELPAMLQTGNKVRMYDGKQNFYAIYEYDEENHTFTNVKMFYNNAG